MAYGLTTWTQPAPSGGGPVSIYVAGMRANTPYHMRAVVQIGGNVTVNDSDHTFTTGAPTAELPTLTASTTAGQTPQNGVELLDLIDTGATAKMIVAVTDLAGTCFGVTTLPCRWNGCQWGEVAAEWTPSH